MKCTCPTRKFCVGTQRNLYSTGLRLGFASGKTQLLGSALGKNAKNVRHPTPEIPTCWYILRWVTQNSGVGCTAQRQPPTPGILRFWWNIGLRVQERHVRSTGFDTMQSNYATLPDRVIQGSRVVILVAGFSSSSHINGPTS